ncbi:PLP-dependent transferase [Enterobacter hormaechei]
MDIDISIQAATKYLIGHSDGMIGTAVSNARCWDQLRENAYLIGRGRDGGCRYRLHDQPGHPYARRASASASRKQPANCTVAGAASAGGAR